MLARMAMRIDVDFSRPLSAADKRLATLALAVLAKVRRVRFARGDYQLHVFGEALGMRSVRAALTEVGLNASALSSTLSAADDGAAEDQPVVAPAADASVPTTGIERVRAIGR